MEINFGKNIIKGGKPLKFKNRKRKVNFILLGIRNNWLMEEIFKFIW